MNRETKKTAVTGLALFLSGVVSLFLSINDDGIFAYILLAYGAWEIGEAVSNYWFDDQEEEERTVEEMKNGFKADVAKITLPTVLSMIVEILMIGNGFRLFTFVAYILTLIIYLLFIAVFTFFEWKEQEEEWSVSRE
ncbi:hypothetical protein ADIAL_1849 [Alkalibacterium sp. AK22]|uniref:hypothetical protein n=1 Tax=Alkalibacterium sp. AK22 TaxID=1229520 RepID=UPI000453126A|nr:hypothetical protein [Alkalibacterium sp. AK22]EXJ22734.1 hypothetical protein ADIAL_1849 [Alkalibacterium sp. AK22]